MCHLVVLPGDCEMLGLLRAAIAFGRSLALRESGIKSRGLPEMERERERESSPKSWLSSDTVPFSRFAQQRIPVPKGPRPIKVVSIISNYDSLFGY